MSRILLVDDEPGCLRKASVGLKKAGFAVDTAADGAEALAKLREKPDFYELVCTDLMMPVMDGIELLTAMRNQPPLQIIPIIVLSYSPSDDGFDRARRDRYVLEDALTAVVYRYNDSLRWGSRWEDTLLEVVELMLKKPEVQPK